MAAGLIVTLFSRTDTIALTLIENSPKGSDPAHIK